MSYSVLRIFLQNTSYSNIIRIFHLCCHSIQYISLFLWYPEVSHRTQLVDLEFVIPFTKMILCKHDGKKQIYVSFVVLFTSLRRLRAFLSSCDQHKNMEVVTLLTENLSIPEIRIRLLNIICWKYFKTYFYDSLIRYKFMKRYL